MRVTEFVAVVLLFAATSECALEERSESGHRCADQAHVDFEAGTELGGGPIPIDKCDPLISLCV